MHKPSSASRHGTAAPALFAPTAITTSRAILRCARRCPSSSSDPNIAAVGAGWSDLDRADVASVQQRFGPVGRALILGQNRGLLHLYADRRSALVLGGAMVGPRCEHLAHLLAWGIQCRLTVQDMLAMPFYHPVIEEALQDGLHQLAKQLQTPEPAASWIGQFLPWRRRLREAAPA